MWRFIVASLITVVALIAWMYASTLCPSLPQQWEPGNRCLIVKFFYDWQQLLGAFTALGAAAIGWFAIKKQIDQSEAQESARLRRRFAAARAVLPLTISRIHEYAFQCCKSLQELAQKNTRGDGAMPWVPPALPADSLTALREFIEAATEAQATPIVRLLSRIQVQSGRLYTLTQSKDRHNQQELMQYIVDTVEIGALSAALYSFARGVTEDPPTSEPSSIDMHSSLAECQIDESLRAHVEKRISRNYRGSSVNTQ